MYWLQGYQSWGVPSTGTLNGAHGNAGLNTNLPPGVTPEILNKVPMKPMQNVKEWSEKLKQEGKDVPLDLKVYEDLIRKDTEFVGKLNKQLHDNKFIMENINRDIKSYNQIKQLRMNSIALSNKGQYNNSIWGRISRLWQWNNKLQYKVIYSQQGFN